MLDRLPGRQKTGIFHIFLLRPLQDFIALFDQPVHRWTFLCSWLLIDKVENLLQPLDLSFSFSEMILKSFCEPFVSRCFCHSRQDSQQLLFGIVQVAQAVVEEVVERGEGHRKFLLLSNA